MTETAVHRFPCMDRGRHSQDTAAIYEAGRSAATAVRGGEVDEAALRRAAIRVSKLAAARVEEGRPSGPFAIAAVYLRPEDPNPDALACARNLATGRCIGCCAVFGPLAPAVQ